jgi:hypothetical protein
VRWLSRLLALVTTDSRLEWLVVASVLVLLALGLALGWIHVELPRRP